VIDIPGVVLAVYAHPDDADVACGGTLARWAKGGASVHLIICTDGGKGTFDPEADTQQLIAERAEELEESSAVIGLSSVTNFGFPDGELVDSDEFRGRLVVDVTGTIEATAAAVEGHRTQFAEHEGWAGEAVRRRAEEEGRRAGTRFAEGFRRLTFSG